MKKSVIFVLVISLIFIIYCGVDETPMVIADTGNDNAEITMYNVHVFSEPSGADVYIDGKDMNCRTPCLNLELSPGRHNVKLIKQGWIQSPEDEVVEIDNKKNISIELYKDISGEWKLIKGAENEYQNTVMMTILESSLCGKSRIFFGPFEPVTAGLCVKGGEDVTTSGYFFLCTENADQAPCSGVKYMGKLYEFSPSESYLSVEVCNSNGCHEYVFKKL